MKRMMIIILLGLTVNSYSQLMDSLSISKVSKVSGKYVFMMSEPVQKYEVVMEINWNFWNSLTLGSKDTPFKIANWVNNKFRRQGRRKKIEYDAIIIGSSSQDFAIRFLE